MAKYYTNPKQLHPKTKRNAGGGASRIASAGEEAVAGMHAVEALLLHAPERIQFLYVSEARRHDARIKKLITDAGNQSIHLVFLASDAFSRHVERYGASEVNQGIMAICKTARHYTEEDLADILKNPQNKSPLFLILDGVTDPHNLGACLRSANAAGAQAVIVPKDRAAPVNATVRKVASGAAEVTPVVAVTNLARTLRFLKEAGVWLYGMAGETTKSLYDIDLRGAVGLVLGAEGEGLRQLTREECDELLAIPMAGSVESLNVSVAAGICLFEAVRQRISCG